MSISITTRHIIDWVWVTHRRMQVTCHRLCLAKLNRCGRRRHRPTMVSTNLPKARIWLLLMLLLLLLLLLLWFFILFRVTWNEVIRLFLFNRKDYQIPCLETIKHHSSRFLILSVVVIYLLFRFDLSSVWPGQSSPWFLDYSAWVCSFVCVFLVVAFRALTYVLYIWSNRMSNFFWENTNIRIINKYNRSSKSNT